VHAEGVGNGCVKRGLVLAVELRGGIREIQRRSQPRRCVTQSVQSLIMCDSVAKRTRSTRKSLGATSSTAITDQRNVACERNSPAVGTTVNKEFILSNLEMPFRLPADAVSTKRKDNSSVGSVVNKRVVPDAVTPFAIKTPSSLRFDRSHGSRPSVASINSASTTGSSIKGDAGFDSPVHSPLCDSTATSPEGDEISPQDKRIPFGYFKDNYRDPPELESPTIAAGRRRESSKSRLALPRPKRSSRLSISLELPEKGRRRSSSEPGVASPTKQEPSLDDQSYSNDSNNNIVSGFKKLSLEDHDTTTSGSSKKGDSRDHARLAAEQGGRPSSAAGRMEETATDKTVILDAARELHNTSFDRMDWEPSPNSNSLHSGKALQPDLSIKVTVADVAELTKPHTTPKVPPVQPNPCVSNPVRTSKPTAAPSKAQQREARNDVDIRDHGIPGKSSTADKEPSEIPKGDSGPDSDANTALSASAESHNLKESGAQSDEESEPGDPGDSDSEPDTSAEDIDLDDDQSIPEAISKEDTLPTVDRELPYPYFLNFDDDALIGKDIKEDLVNLIKKQITIPKSGKREGSIYVYSSLACPGFFKAGFTSETVRDRLKRWKDCGFVISLVKDGNQRRFRYAKHVEKLVQIELHPVRRKFACRKHKQKKSRNPRIHNEWYEINPEHLLQVIEKWRHWITMLEDNPYDDDGALTPRWLWKLDKWSANREGLELDHFLRPFTDWEDLMYRKDWILDTCKDLYAQGKRLNKAMTDSALLVAILCVLWFLVNHLGLQGGIVCFALLVTSVTIVLSR
jgi:T5orf172 domain